MKSTPQKREGLSSATLTQTLALIVFLSGLVIATTYAAPPAWWSSRGAVAPPQVVTNSGVVTTNYAPNNYAVVNQGELKQFTARAVEEMNANLPGGAGTSLTNLVYSWHQDYATHGYNATNLKPSDFTVMNQSQLKYIGNLVWSRLAAAGYTNAMPSWLATNSTDANVANLGQLKTIFNFDLSIVDTDQNGLGDAWEMQYFGHLGNVATNLAPAGNGLTLLQDYQQGNDPNNYYSQGGNLITPTLTITGGNNQTGPIGTFLSLPLMVTVKNGSTPLVNAPIIFTVSGGMANGGLAISAGGFAITPLTVTTDSTGTAQVCYAGATTTGTATSIPAAAGTATVTFAESTSFHDTSVAAPTNVTQRVGSTNGQFIITWTNNATNATFLLIQKSTDGINWTTIATLNDPTITTYTDTESDPSQSYYFGVIAGYHGS